jgi:hypothetical protein
MSKSFVRFGHSVRFILFTNGTAFVFGSINQFAAQAWSPLTYHFFAGKPG